MAINKNNFVKAITNTIGRVGSAIESRNKRKDVEDEVREKAVKESERIFMKNRPDMAMKDGTFPKASESMPNKYNREAMRTQKQVVETRLRMMKEKNK